MSNQASAGREPIAIIGLSCRFPDASTPEAYWSLLNERRSATRPVPKERWESDAYYDPEPRAPGKTNAKEAAFLDEVFAFDPRFFGISEREAGHMDPQQRIALELAWEAFERAGLVMDSLRDSRTGVYMGTMGGDYGKTSISSGFGDVDAYHLTGNWGSFLPGHLAYFFGLGGPVVAVDAACASSLVAVHLASEGLRARECDLALAGAVSLMLSPELSIVLTKAGALSPDGRSRAFDASANGMGRGEGGAVLVLKRLSDARAAGDPILALVAGSATNHNGQSAGFTVPNGVAQARVIREALRAAGANPETISYVEAHGTGTRLGDPIEARALAEVFRRPSACPLAIGSVKTNLGHLDAAAGMAGLIKVVLGLERGLLPGQLYFEAGNPEVDWSQAGLRVVTETEPWPRTSIPRQAGVSAYGMSGINAHVIVREAPSVAPPPVVRHDGWVLPLTAHSDAALRMRAAHWAERLSQSNEDECSRLLATAAHRLTHLESRIVARGNSRSGLVDQLREYATGALPKTLLAGRKLDGAGVCMVFSGQGSAWPGMARSLWGESASFRAAAAACIEQFDHSLRPSLLDALTGDGRELADTRVAQPAIFCTQVGLLQVWKDLGLKPSLVVGHSLGEVTAAYAAGLIGLSLACHIVALRSSLMQVAVGGRMAMVPLERGAVEERIAAGGFAVEIAAVNGPNATVISGESSAVEQLARELSSSGLQAHLLDIDYAFHSQKLDEIEAPLLRGLGDIESTPPTLVMISTVDGEPVARVDAAYWFSNARRPVEFRRVIEQCVELGCSHFLEVAPHPVLARDIRATLRQRAVADASVVVHSLSRSDSDLASLRMQAQQLFVAGVSVDWAALGVPQSGLAPVPPYPWQKRRFRLVGSQQHPPATSAEPLLGEASSVATDPDLRFWQRPLKVDSYHYLADHRAQATVVVPGALLLGMFAAAAKTQTEGDRAILLRDVKFLQPLALSEEPRTLQVSSKNGALTAASSDEGGGWRVHSTARVGADMDAHDAHAGFRPLSKLAAQLKLERVTAAPEREYGGAEHRRRMQAMGMSYGPSFSAVQRVVRRGPEAIVEISATHLAPRSENDGGIHPTLLDCCLQAAGVFFEEGGTLLPAAIKTVRWPVSPIPRSFTCHARMVEASGRGIVAQIRALDVDGEPFLEIDGLELVDVNQARAPQPRNEVFEVEWREIVDSLQVDLPPGCVLFDDERGYAESFGERLRARGVRVVSLIPGAGFAELGPNRFAINPHGAQCLMAFFARLPEATAWPQVHFWNLRASVSEDAASVESFLACACGSLAALLQARQQSGVRGSVPLVVVTHGAQAAGQVAVGSWLQAASWGFVRTARVEMPAQIARCVDLESGAGVAEAAERLTQEVFVRNAPPEVLLRGGKRLAPVLVAARPADREVSVSEQGSHVIIGGTGGVGLALARALVDRGAKSLALFARGPASPSATALIRALESRGARVKVYAVDAASLAALRAALRVVTAELAPVVGIVHAAGVLDDTSISRMTWTQLWSVLSPKVLTAHHLDRLADEHELQYLSLFSSISSLLGNPGQANYAAANAALDALAEHRALAGKVGSAINWGAWADTGMLAGKKETTHRLAERGVRAFPPEQACAAFFKVPDRTRRAIVSFDADKWLRTYNASWLRDFLRELSSVDQSEADSRQALGALPPAEARQRISSKMKSLLAAVLRADPSTLDENTSFDRLGIDSILGLEFTANIDAAFSIELGVSALWSFPKLRSLSEHVGELLGLSEADEGNAVSLELTADESAALQGLVGQLSGV